LKKLIRFTFGAGFALAGLSIVFLFEAGLFALGEYLFSTESRPVGLGWITLPIAGAIGGWKVGIQLSEPSGTAMVLIRSILATQIGRLILVSILIWLLYWTAHCYNHLEYGHFVSDLDYGYSWSNDDWIVFGVGFLGGPIGICLVYVALRWIKAGK
jgi:hypothetical protein